MQRRSIRPKRHGVFLVLAAALAAPLAGEARSEESGGVGAPPNAVLERAAPVRPAPPAAAIGIVSATYGRNCGVAEGNATSFVAAACNGRKSCDFRIYYRELGDPKFGCEKEFVVTYRCAQGGAIRQCFVAGEAGLGGEGGQPNNFCNLRC